MLEIAKRLGRRDHAGDRVGALRRAGHRHRASSCTRTRGPASHRMAAELIEAGVDVNDIYRRLYERVPIEKLHADRAGAREDRALRRRPASRSPTSAPRTTPRPGAGRGAHRGDHRLRPRARGGRGRGDDPRQDRRRPLGAQGQPALDRRQSTSRRSPALTAAAGTGVPPASAATCRIPSWSSSSAPRSPLNALSERACGPRRRRRRDPAGRQAGRDHIPRRGRPGAARVRRQSGPRRHSRPVRDAAS